MVRKTSAYRCRSWNRSWNRSCWRICCWRICITHQSMARAEAAAAPQPLSRGKSTPIRGIPSHCSTSGACPHSSGFGALRSLPFSTHLVQGLLSLVLGVAGGEPHTRAVWALLGLCSWCHPRGSSTPRCHPGRSVSPLQLLLPQGSSSQPWHRTSTATSKHGSVPPGLLSAPSVPQSKPLTQAGHGDAGREVSTPLWL